MENDNLKKENSGDKKVSESKSPSATAPKTPSTPQKPTSTPKPISDTISPTKKAPSPTKSAPSATRATPSITPKPSPSPIKPNTNSTQNPDRPVVKPVNIDSSTSSKNLVQEDAGEKDKKKKRRLLILLLLLLLLIIIGGAVALVLLLQPSEEINVTITIDAGANEYDAEEIKNKKFIPGDEIPIYLKFKVTDEKLIQTGTEFYVRYKISADIDGTYISGLFDPLPVRGTEPESIKGGDGYFYYKHVVGATNAYVTAFDKLDFVAEYENNILNGKTVQISIRIEIIEASMSAVNGTTDWQTAPNEWRQIVA